MRRTLETQQTCRSVTRQSHRCRQPGLRFGRVHVLGEDALHIPDFAFSDGLTSGLWRAQALVEHVADPVLRKGGSQYVLGEPRFAGERDGPYIEHGLHAGRDQKVQQLRLEETFVADCENGAAQADRLQPGRAACLT